MEPQDRENTRPPEDLVEVGGYWKHRIVLTALRLDLFTLLAPEPLAAGEVARRLKVAQHALEVFLRALVALGLLERRGERFANSPFAGRTLVWGRPGYRGDQLLVDEAYWGLWGRLEEVLRTGRSPLKSSIFHSDPEATEKLVLGLHRDALRLAPVLADLVPLDGRRSLLDLGGGAGTYAMEYCRRHPALRATVLDLPNATRVARSVIAREDLEGRIAVVDGDFVRDPIPGLHDAVLMSNVLHGQGAEGNQALFDKVHGCLEPGGIVIIRDVVMNDGLTEPAWGAVFSVNMLLHTGEGRCYAFPEIRGWLEAAGFQDIRQVSPNEVITASKGTRNTEQGSRTGPVPRDP